MNVHAGHLKDDVILECYFAARGGEALDPRAAEHLADCDACVARYDDVVAFMDGARDEAEVETDAVFTPERLQDQQDQIMRRLTHVHRAARVISFPAKESTAPSRSALHLTPRWLAAAAAAGLFIGVAVGGYVGPNRFHVSSVSQKQVAVSTAPAMTVQPHPTSATAVRVSGSAQDTAADDDAFLAELELALARPHTRELQPFDAMTPHVRDIDDRSR